MMPHRKAQASDPDRLRDETVDPVERSAALSRLVSDQRREFEPDIAKLLVHDEPLLRAKALVALAGRWHIGTYVNLAVRALGDDPDWLVRRNAAHALSMYAQRDQVGERGRTPILRTLARAVQSDGDPGVQEAAYEAILRVLGRPAEEYFHEARDFDSQQDVDWTLLAPYLSETDDIGH